MTSLKSPISDKIIYGTWPKVCCQVNYRNFTRESVGAIFYPIIDIIFVRYDEIG